MQSISLVAYLRLKFSPEGALYLLVSWRTPLAGELLTVGPREASKPNKNRSCGSYTLSSRLKAVSERIMELWSHEKRAKCVVLFSARTFVAKLSSWHVMHVYCLLWVRSEAGTWPRMVCHSDHAINTTVWGHESSSTSRCGRDNSSQGADAEAVLTGGQWRPAS